MVDSSTARNQNGYHYKVHKEEKALYHNREFNGYWIIAQTCTIGPALHVTCNLS